MKVFGGILGAILGFAITFVLVELSAIGSSGEAVISRAILGLLVICPLGAVVGAVLGVRWAARRQAQ